MKKLIIVFTLLIGCLTSAKAQEPYMGSLGIRAGSFEFGFTGKYFMYDYTAIEGIIGFRPGVFVATGLYEKHAPAFEVQDLTWYFGVGAHIGGINGERYRRYVGNDDKVYESGILLGADAILGLEWKVPEFPLTLGLDLHPRLELGKGPFLDLEPALSIRYIIR